MKAAVGDQDGGEEVTSNRAITEGDEIAPPEGDGAICGGGRDSSAIRSSTATTAAAGARNLNSMHRHAEDVGSRLQSSIARGRDGSPRPVLPGPAPARDRCEAQCERLRANPPLRLPHRAAANRSRGAADHTLSEWHRLERCQKQVDRAAAISCGGPPPVPIIEFQLKMQAFNSECVKL